MIKRVPRKYFHKVIQKAKDGNTIEVYENLSQASIKTGIKIGDITRACRANSESERKRNHTSKGYIWEFAR